MTPVVADLVLSWDELRVKGGREAGTTVARRGPATMISWRCYATCP